MTSSKLTKNREAIMKNNKYIGHTSQIAGVEEHRLVGGKGDGMRLFQVRNGKGLEFTVSADRCADISRLSFKGDNYAYFSPCGYVAPAYYDEKGIGFLKSFTAGFLTTCGLTAVGSPCTDEGVKLPLHGTVSHCPAESIYSTSNDSEITIHAVMNQASIFSDKLALYRKITCSLEKNEITITDTIKNVGSTVSPCMILYHINIGYPLLDEHMEMFIPSKQVVARNEHAQKSINEWDKINPPTAGFEEQCYFHSFEKTGLAAVYNATIDKGLAIEFDAESLNQFVEWKMTGEKEYVLGLEPGNCLPDGRDQARKNGTLKFIEPDEEITYSVKITIIENATDWVKWRILC